MTRHRYKKNWLPYPEAEAFVHALGLKSRREWKAYCKSGKKPKNIPKTPENVYQEWTNYGTWLGIGSSGSHKRIFRKFELAREFARSLGFTCVAQWHAFCKSGKRPKDIPSNPSVIYRNHGWIDYHDWFGITMEMPFDEAREFVRNLKLGSIEEWKFYCKSNLKPKGIPSSPDKCVRYKDQWKGYVDWLGKPTTKPTYNQVKEFIAGMGFLCENDYVKWARNNKSLGFPIHARTCFLNNGWVDWDDFLNIPPNLAYEEAREYAISLNLNTKKEWTQHCKEHGIPQGIPKRPDLAYQDKGWTSWYDWLGTSWWTFEEARAYLRSLMLSSEEAWRKYQKEHGRPKRMPSNPESVYGEEWTTWSDCLGNPPPHDRVYRSFFDARAYVRELKLRDTKTWMEYCKSGKKPKDIPSHPHIIYKNSGWSSMADWLGSKNIGPTKHKFPAYEEFLRIIETEQRNGRKLKTANDYYAWTREQEFPLNMPKNPEKYYSKNH